MRLPGSAAQSVEIAHALLDHGADPNASWNDAWDNAFKVLTGVIGLGEGVKPPHERADELVALLLERGADADRPTKQYGGPLGFAAHFGQRAAAELIAPYSRDVHNMVFLQMKERLRQLFAEDPAS